jgi:hypothetical protein
MFAYLLSLLSSFEFRVRLVDIDNENLRFTNLFFPHEPTGKMASEKYQTM